MKVVKRVYVLLLVMAAFVSGCSLASRPSQENETVADEVNVKFLSELILYQYGKEISTWQSLKPDQEQEESTN